MSCILSSETSVTYIPDLSCRSQNSAGTENGPSPLHDSSSVPVHISCHIFCPDLRQPYVRLEKSKGGIAAGTWMLIRVGQVEVALLRFKFDSIWNDARQDVGTCFCFYSWSTFTLFNDFGDRKMGRECNFPEARNHT